MSRGDSTDSVLESTNREPSREKNSPLLRCNGQEFKHMIQASMSWVERHRSFINSLNVFPVPDGDTGTNMYLTLQAAWQEIANTAEDSIFSISQSVAHGALMGARGNSGVILSQLFRGIAQGLENVSEMDVASLSHALRQASATAYKAVIRPVEGTILTVAAKAAEASDLAAAETTDLKVALTRIVEAAKRAVDETPSQLPVLAEAGVVDAGGQGLYVILEGMLRYLTGETAVADATLEETLELVHPHGPEEGYGYDVQFVLQGLDLDVEQIRAAIDSMGDSTLVVGDSATVKVHVHTPNPGDPLNYGAGIGSLSRVIVENLQEQYQDFMKHSAGSHAKGVPQPKLALPSGIGIVAVVPGAGLARVYESLGTTAIVPGGQTMNPSTEDLLKAVNELEAHEIIILPNNKNVILTAEQVQKLSDRRIRVVPSKSIPQGISALLAFNYQADLDINADAMKQALQTIQTGEITLAVRSVKIDGIKVKKGQIIGLLNGSLVASGNDYATVVLKLLKRMRAKDLEIITIYYGDQVNRQDADSLAGAISAQYPDQEIEIVDGGQPHYPYILSAE